MSAQDRIRERLEQGAKERGAAVGRTRDPLDLLAVRFRPAEPTLEDGTLDVRALCAAWDHAYNRGLPEPRA